MTYPTSISFTITNACNLRCQMCGQWSEEGYIQNDKSGLRQNLALADWKRLVDELADHHVTSLLIRGGEPFMYPGIIELLAYIHSRGMFIAIDTNATLLKDFAGSLLEIGNIHLTVSVDGPEEIHDQVRGVKGSFRRTREGLERLSELEKSSSNKISRSICFTISPFSIAGLGQMPEVARSLGIKVVTIVPYYYVPEAVGKMYEKELQESLGCHAFTWRGFHHETSGVSFEEFQEQYHQYLATLGDIYNYPYMSLTEDEYREWFAGPLTPVLRLPCSNVEKLIDIQPGGEANFCVDFPDYSIGNVRDASIEALWNGEKAARFREYRRKTPLPVCYRCGSKYMSEISA
ncbi:MAG: radical SAM protein [Chloroflexota bacterium]|nr:MAG: radical SAM protein [Chloroflexota bacterium]